MNSFSFNLRRLHSLRPRQPLIAVVKADAYGHGLFAVAQRFEKEGVKMLAVANLSEAEIASRAAPRADILILSPLLPWEMKEALRFPKWIPTLCHPSEFLKLQEEAVRKKRRVRVHLKLDTGMGRVGNFSDGLLNLARCIDSSPWLIFDGLYSHLASAGVDPDQSLRQLAALEIFCGRLQLTGIHLPPVHFENSAGAILWGNSRKISSLARGVRPGLALYGVPVPLAAWIRKFGPHPLRPVLTWKTRVALVREMPAGSTISYGATYRTRKRTRVAVLAAGYADGISRKLSHPSFPSGKPGGEVLIHGKRCRILGCVTMDMIMVEIAHLPRVQWGDPVTLIGGEGSGEITAGEMAEWAETNPYEVLCNISKRVPRILI